MPIKSRISTLPARLRAQLDRRLIAAGFADIVKTAAWLQTKGHRVSKSSVGVHSKRLKAQIEAEAQAEKAAQMAPSTVALRLACLQAAARAPGSPAVVLKRAEAYAGWVKAGRMPGGRR